MNFKSLNLKNQIRPGQMIYKINFTKTNKIESEIESNSNFIKILPLSQHYFNKFLKFLSSMITQWLFLPPSFFISSNSDKKNLIQKRMIPDLESDLNLYQRSHTHSLTCKILQPTNKYYSIYLLISTDREFINSIVHMIVFILFWKL